MGLSEGEDDNRICSFCHNGEITGTHYGHYHAEYHYHMPCVIKALKNDEVVSQTLAVRIMKAIQTKKAHELMMKRKINRQAKDLLDTMELDDE